ncbi:Toll/interleukin-1 receptor homology (TIR) domain [Arabidopsis thaliana x Arabidopsis arenosa]|uniref:Toll/interleukin-1 receptor homology (TIR) domain n=1 Tax=Arabidopsis thaliana x Arabidopsis arenosa TaxID=1240361 RepID=A0A8T2A8N9_9BRAS|nr:Toll/interleukin-1 receptor homology (TIR) domain [Arabidopsis thaliana x Arabidopsis arenosa]
MSASSSSSSTRNFYVFVSFRGQETRKTFVSHLRCSLDRRGIATLEDENELRGGQSDPSVVDRTIGESKVAVVLISEKYASSPWSLESLVKIMGFHHSGLLSVIPVFYDIDPSDVKKQSGKLWEPFSLHERENPKNVQTWRQTLSQLADSPSCQYSENWKGDAEMIGKITDEIWDMLIGSKSSDLCGLVGMDRHIKAMYKFLDFGLKDDVRLIQIWGREGIGKTELANYIYKEVLHHFDTHFWLDIPKERDDEGKYARNLINQLYYREQAEKVLLVVDTGDARNISHFERELRSFSRQLGPGSRVFIITKEEQSLHYSQVDFRYEVVGLEFSESFELFCLRAFKQTHPFLGFEELSCRAVKLTGGSPLTINILGLRLSGRDKDEWDVILSAYERSSDKGIIQPDKIIFDLSVTDSVSTQSRTTINYSKDLVGMNSRMQAVLGLLELGSDKEVRVVGIWGTGGIGKTTLARYAYEEISQKFHTHVFLEIAEERMLSFCIEDQFLSKAIEREAFPTRNSKDGSEVMKSGLPHQKVLLIVDGVNNKALTDVWKIATRFGPGSRVIVTTRDKSLLVANGVKHVYEVSYLRFDEALQLFNQFAFKQNLPSDRFKQLSVHVIKLVGFLPLALKVTGSMLFGQNENYWETILQSFEEKQDEVKVEVSAK